MADYWIKWYIEIIDDPKMATLPDRLWRRFSELCLITGKLYPDKSGKLPDSRQIAWLLRMETDEVQIDLEMLAGVGVIRPIPNGWLVVNFSKRQQATPSSERVKQHRERKQREGGNENETHMKRKVTQSRAESEQNQNQNREEERADARASSDRLEIKLYTKISGHTPTYLEEDRIVTNFQTAHQRRKCPPLAVFEEYLTDCYTDWCATERTDGSGRTYSATNPAWTDWAAAGNWPKPNKQQTLADAFRAASERGGDYGDTK